MPRKEAGHKVSVLGNKCYRCNHFWIPRNIDQRPAVCPKCKSPYWDKPKKDKNGMRISSMFQEYSGHNRELGLSKKNARASILKFFLKRSK